MMTRLIQRMALRLLSAGVFSFCSLTIVSSLAAEVDPGKVRLEAIKVELALLSDSNAYSQPLTVRVHGDGVEVQGTVASESLRQHILDLARRSCYLPIHDKLAVAGGAPRATVPLVKAAHDRLVRELGAQADSIRIQYESGKLKLAGQVRSLEDKLHASRTLRGLPGCGGLVNELVVKADSGPSFTLVTHANEEPQLVPLTQETQAPSSTEVALPPLTPTPKLAIPPAPVATLPSGLPPTRVMAVQVESADRGRSQSHTVLYVVPPSTGAASRPATVQTAPAVQTQLTPVAPLAAPAVTQEPSPSPTVWPPAHRNGLVTTPAPAGTLYQSHPLSQITRSTAAPAAPALQPVLASQPSAVKQVAHKPVASKVSTGELIRKIKAASGPYARDVRIETGADAILAVHVYATAGGEQLLTTKLFDVPELTQSNVRLHVHLAQ